MKLEIITGNASIKLSMPDGSVVFAQSYTDYSMTLDLQALASNIPTIVEMVSKAMTSIENIDKAPAHTKRDNVVFPDAFSKPPYVRVTDNIWYNGLDYKYSDETGQLCDETFATHIDAARACDEYAKSL